MADNFRANVKSRSTTLYKNSMIDDDLTSLKNTHPTLTYQIDVPNINNIDLSQFNIVYSSNDTNKEYPIYVKLYKNENVDYSRPTTELYSEKLNLNNVPITFMSLDDPNNIIGTGSISENPKLKYLNIPYNENMYALAPPFSNDSSGRRNYIYAPEDSGLSTGANRVFVKTLDVIKTLIDGNENIKGLPVFERADMNYAIVPYNIDTNQEFYLGNFFTTFKDTTIYLGQRNQTSSEDKFGFSSKRNGQTISFNSLRNKSSIVVKGVSSANPENYDSDIFNLVSTNPKAYSPDDQWEYYTAPENTRIISYAFLADDNKKFWILTLSAAWFTEGTNPVYPGYFTTYYSLFPVKSMPTSFTDTSTTLGEYGTLSRTSTVDIQKTLELLIPIETYGYSDDGPDIVGPGDPYEEDSNAGDSVGGDSDTTDVIETPDTTPNVSYENFIINNGLYGSYSLTPDNLKNYTKTIQICRDNSWLPGEIGDKCEQMANLIQENTTSVFMLPVLIPNGETEINAFNVGTKGIRNVDVLGDFGKESSLDQARLIKKFTAEYPVPLGNIRHYYDNFLDFAPFSSASLYIPYIGKVELPINLIQSTSTSTKDLSLSIRLNRTNGDLLCILLVDNIPICRWQGNCARNIAMSVNDNSGILQNQFGRLVASLSSGVNSIGSAATGNISGAVSGLVDMASAHFSGGSPITTSSHMIGGAPESGDTGWLDSQNIILTIERPIWWKPYDYGELVGYPTKKIAKLSSVKGFARVPQIHIRCSATESEKERLKNMLAEGVLF